MIDTGIIFDSQFSRSLVGPRPPAGKILLSTDSRTLTKNNLFVALSGPHFNGLDFALHALEKGAIGVVYTKDQDSKNLIPSLFKKYNGCHFIEVSDTYEYLKLVAQAHVTQWRDMGGRIIGITGSNGKTTTKEMLAFMLKSIIGDELFYTKGNFNNQVGVPLTVFKLHPDHSLAVIELGTNQPGEIGRLCEMTSPNMGIITNISNTHIEYLKDRAGVFQEKRALYDAVMTKPQKGALFVLNADDEYLRKLPEKKGVITFGESFGAHRIHPLKQGIQIDIAGETFTLKNDAITGAHNFINLACSFLLVQKLFPTRVDDIITAANNFCPPTNRSSWIKHRQSDVFLDAYNANPASMKAAIDGFSNALQVKNIAPEHTLWVVGDMNELGEHAAIFHRELGETLDRANAVNVIYIGQYYNYFQEGLKNCKAHHLNTVHDFKNALGAEYFDAFKAIFIKGSRSLQLESLVDIK